MILTAAEKPTVFCWANRNSHYIHRFSLFQGLCVVVTAFLNKKTVSTRKESPCVYSSWLIQHYPSVQISFVHLFLSVFFSCFLSSLFLLYFVIYLCTTFLPWFFPNICSCHLPFCFCISSFFLSFVCSFWYLFVFALVLIFNWFVCSFWYLYSCSFFCLFLH